MIEPLAVGVEGLVPFLVPVALFACGFVGYLALVAINRWLKNS